ncbi:hypothetical protein CON74_25575 [Bacillus thuringiensis]|uniref:hypothetical protein n=1 Tax=Bacillus thuringiensis TaxID=1428 RepID=UPI000BECEE79|nr:hypothetical protein [Bacillus thuringiensis]PEA58033.1 hypothetical protein CON74_25575 [Bacillus thuringiensis]HDR8143057.1 hypothetical protein [Bacillus cereus]
MIKIERENLDFLAKRHYEEYFVKKGFLKRLEKIKDNEKDLMQKRFFESLFNQIEDIIKGRPIRLNEIIRNLSADYPVLIKKIEKYNFWKKKLREAIEKQKKLTISINKGSSNLEILMRRKSSIDTTINIANSHVQQTKKFLDKIHKIFNYNNFCEHYNATGEGERIWGAYELVKQLNVGVCPYCNRQFITVSEPNKDDGGRTRPQLDHFYSKSNYPFLSISFFNLIPCCYVCNSNLKRNQEFSIDTHIHPYENGFEDMLQFTVKFRSEKAKEDYLQVWSSNTEMFSIDFKINALEKQQYNVKEFRSLYNKIKNNKQTFKLKSLYNTHIDYVGEIIAKSIEYNDDRIESLCKDFPELFSRKEDAIRVVYSNYVEMGKMDKRVLAKLTRDITKEFGIKYT